MCMQNEDTNLCYKKKFICEQQSNMLYLSLCMISYILFVFVCFLSVSFSLSVSFFSSLLCVYFLNLQNNNVCVCHCVVMFYFFFFFCSLRVLYSSSHKHVVFFLSSFFLSFFSLLFLFRQNINDDQLKYEIE